MLKCYWLAEAGAHAVRVCACGTHPAALRCRVRRQHHLLYSFADESFIKSLLSCLPLVSAGGSLAVLSAPPQTSILLHLLPA